ncbi:MAG: RNA-binding protein [Marinosulfonomonas sp.]|nr:MAG: RNA-binding protein [Marinosulfonomonas sp.]
MPKGPKGEKRPADAIGLAVMIGRIATGEESDNIENDGKDPAAKSLGSKGGKKRASNLSPERRKEIAQQAAAKRWGKS